MAGSTRKGLFAASFAAVTATSFCFVLRALVVDDWGRDFALNETQKGELLGVGLWPFAVSIVMLSLVIDRIGFRRSLWLAGAAHLVGITVLFLADGYWMLYCGTFIMALGNGAVEAAVNPLIATIYPEDRATWLNRLHAAWPGGMVVGGLLAIFLGPQVEWRWKIALMLLPVAIYFLLCLKRQFPVSGRAAAGVSYREMLGDAGAMSAVVIIGLIMLEIGRVFDLSTATVCLSIAILTAIYFFASRSFGRPLYLILVLIMVPVAITELSTDGWIVSLMSTELDRLGLQPGWLLVYTAGIVFASRLYAGVVIHRLSALGTLAAASAVTALGLFAMSMSHGLSLLVAATIYGIGKSFFWGTSLAVASDQFPKGGAVSINVLAGAGMLAAGILGSVFLGTLQDQATWRNLEDHDRKVGSSLVSEYLSERRQSLLGAYRPLDPVKIKSASQGDSVIIKSAEINGKRSALSSVAILPVFLTVIYLVLAMWFRSRGGYHPVYLAKTKEMVP